MTPLTDRERKFYAYWAQRRNKHSLKIHFLLVSLRNGVIFCCFVLMMFLSGWYKRVPFLTLGEWISVLIGLVISVGVGTFFAVRYRIEQYEQEYQTIGYKLKKEQNQTKP